MMVEQFPGMQQLSMDQKWILANELWKEVEEHQAELTTPPEIRALIEQRFADFERAPDSALTLEEFKRRSGLP